MINAARRPPDEPLDESPARPLDSGFGETLLGDSPWPKSARRINLKPEELKNGRRNWCWPW